MTLIGFIGMKGHECGRLWKSHSVMNLDRFHTDSRCVQPLKDLMKVFTPINTNMTKNSTTSVIHALSGGACGWRWTSQNSQNSVKLHSTVILQNKCYIISGINKFLTRYYENLDFKKKNLFYIFKDTGPGQNLVKRIVLFLIFFGATFWTS